MSGSSNKVGGTSEYAQAFDNLSWEARVDTLKEQAMSLSLSDEQLDELGDYERICFKHVGQSVWAQWLEPELLALGATGASFDIEVAGSGCVSVPSENTEAALASISTWGVVDV